MPEGAGENPAPFTVPLLCHFCAVKGPQRVTQLHTENKEKPHCEAIFGLTMRF